MTFPVSMILILQLRNLFQYVTIYHIFFSTDTITGGAEQSQPRWLHPQILGLPEERRQIYGDWHLGRRSPRFNVGNHVAKLWFHDVLCRVSSLNYTILYQSIDGLVGMTFEHFWEVIKDDNFIAGATSQKYQILDDERPIYTMEGYTLW